MKQQKMLNTNKGITLIALVITVIVMLILVAVTISMAVNGGLFDYAGKATGDTKNALNAEQQLSNGAIKVDGVWYDSIDDYIAKNPSSNQGETTGKWKQFAAGYDEGTDLGQIYALKTNGDVYKYSTATGENETTAQFRKLIKYNGKVVDITEGYYIMENGKAYDLGDDGFICINDEIEALQNEKIVLVGDFIITEEGKAYDWDGICINDDVTVLNDKKILNAGYFYLSDSEEVLMVILEDHKVYYMDSEEKLICFSDMYEEIKYKKIVSSAISYGEALLVSEDGKGYYCCREEIYCESDAYEGLKDKKIIKFDSSSGGYILDNGELMYYNDSEDDYVSLNNEIEALKGRKIIGLDYLDLIWLEGGTSYYSIEYNEIVDLEEDNMQEFLTGEKIVQMSANGDTFLAIDTEGKLWAWGDNSDGEFGDGKAVGESSEPICVSDLEDNPLKEIKITQVSTGISHSVAIDDNGKVWSWGADNITLGKGTIIQSRLAIPVSLPVCISDIEGHPLNGIKVIQVSCGFQHTVAIDENGKVWTWGFNDHGQLGYEPENAWSDVPTCISDIEVNPLKGIKIIQISTEYKHNVAVDSNGKIWTWGYGSEGNLGNGTNEDSSSPICISDIEGNPLKGVKISQVSAGEGHVLALDFTGRVWSWGSNSVGQLGDSSVTVIGKKENYEIIPVVMAPHSTAPICVSKTNSILDGTQMLQIEAGCVCSVLLDSNDDYYIFGEV